MAKNQNQKNPPQAKASRRARLNPKVSAGKQIKKVRAIIYDIKDGRPYFLILHRVLHWQGWELLKETIEPGESNEKALKRGIREETGLKKFEIIKSLNKQERWRSLGNDYVIVDVFLVRVDMDEKISFPPASPRGSRGGRGKQLPREHDNYQWAEKEIAFKKLTWPKSKKLLKGLSI